MDFDKITNFFSSPLYVVMVRFFYFFIFVVWGSLVYWTYRDARQRGAMAMYWAIVVAAFNIFGWVVYMIIRPSEYLKDVEERELEIKAKSAVLSQEGTLCPQCAKVIEKDFLVCPYCKKRLKTPCPHCHRPLKPTWALCPYCQRAV